MEPMASGSYFEACKGSSNTQEKWWNQNFGNSTVEDRIAQMVAKMYFEPLVEPMFYNDSYGYRPNKSAIQAVGQSKERCFKETGIGIRYQRALLITSNMDI